MKLSPSRARVCNCGHLSLMLERLVCRISKAFLSLSRKMASLAPRLRDSIPMEPVPANTSIKPKRWINGASVLKRDSLRIALLERVVAESAINSL